MKPLSEDERRERARAVLYLRGRATAHNVCADHAQSVGAKDRTMQHLAAASALTLAAIEIERGGHPEVKT